MKILETILETIGSWLLKDYEKHKDDSIWPWIRWMMFVVVGSILAKSLWVYAPIYGLEDLCFNVALLSFTIFHLIKETKRMALSIAKAIDRMAKK